MVESEIDPLYFIEDDPYHKACAKISGNSSIHSSEAIAFYKDQLKADAFVISILKHGLLFAFEKEPGKYQEPNNRSAVENGDLVWNQI